MATYECPKCGRKYDVDNICCGDEMEREDNKLRCNICGNEEAIPSCCGEEMVEVLPQEEQQVEKEE